MRSCDRAFVRVCVCACVSACVCVRACVRACVCDDLAEQLGFERKALNAVLGLKVVHDGFTRAYTSAPATCCPGELVKRRQ